MSFVYNSFRFQLANGEVDWDANEFVAALVSTEQDYALNGTPDDGTADPTTGTDYTEVQDIFTGAAGTPATEFSDPSYSRQVLPAAADPFIYDAATDEIRLDAGDVTWTALNGDSINSVLIIQRATAGADALTDKCVALLTSANLPKTANGGDMTMTIPADGVWKIG